MNNTQDNNTKQVAVKHANTWKPTITTRNLNIFAMHVAGYPTNEIAQEFGIAEATVRDHVAKVKRELEGIEPEQLQNCVKGLFPIGLESLEHNLRNKKEKTTIQYMKGIKGFVPHQTSDNRTLNLHIHKIADKLRLNRVQLAKAEVVDDDNDDN